MELKAAPAKSKPPAPARHSSAQLHGPWPGPPPRKLWCIRGASSVLGLAAVPAAAACLRHRNRRGRLALGAAASGEKLFSFGVIADVQYADQDDARNFTGSRLRRYRQSKALWEKAVDWWRQEDVAFIAQLGDFLDGSCRAREGEGLRALQSLVEPLEGGPPTVNLLGNHELYNFTREDLQEGIDLPGISEPFSIAAPSVLKPDLASPSPYYSFSPAAGWRVCVLDPYDFSILSSGGGRPGLEVSADDMDPDALELCQQNNPNNVLERDFARGIPDGPAKRWLPFNGSLGKAQLSWLRKTLQQAYEADEHTILLSHVILHPEATPSGSGITLLWNYEELQAILREAPKPPVAVLCGHAHLAVHHVDEPTGTHHVTLASPLEVDFGSDASAVVDAYPDGTLQIRGRGEVPDAVLKL